MFDLYRSSPQLRAFLRALAAGVVVYFIKIQGDGYEAFELASFLWGLAGVVVISAAGYLTPLEPLIGVKAKVEVPAATTTPTA